ncbi:MAG TPA: CPBP family intramembrane glutamic endopeptidase, partial [Usitatibacter sp.]|nr:CPBP family intramembrane glutamic endopeptidase [Usitatibacter sp.]
MARSEEIPAPLADPALAPRHVVFLFGLMYLATSMLGVTWGRSIDPAIRFAWEELVIHGLAALFGAMLALAIPQLRRSLPTLYSPARVPLSARDALVFLALMIAWGYGAHRMLVLFPLLQWHPALLTVLALEHAPSVGATFLLLWSLNAGLFAPFIEELVFRGYLQNLWQRRWGLWPGVLLSALAFGAVHLQYGVFATIAGVFLSLVYLKYRSLWPGTLLHALYNLVAAPYSLGTVLL